MVEDSQHHRASVYVATSLQNYEQAISLQLRFRGLGVTPTFDWASLWKEQLEGATVDKSILAAQMADGVRQAKVVLLLMPAKRGAHVEMGIAIGLGIPVVVYNPSPADDISFYLSPNVQVCRDVGVAFRAAVTLAKRTCP